MRPAFIIFLVLGFMSCKKVTMGTSESATDSIGAPIDSKPCSSTLILGPWQGSIAGNPDTMTFNDDCRGTSTYCQSNFTYPTMTAYSGLVMITNISTNWAPGCLRAGLHRCFYEVSGAKLSFNCGGNTLQYTR
jgi:hypothetical protein